MQGNVIKFPDPNKGTMEAIKRLVEKEKIDDKDHDIIFITRDKKTGDIAMVSNSFSVPKTHEAFIAILNHAIFLASHSVYMKD